MRWGTEEVLHTERQKMKEEFRLTEAIERVFRKQSLYWSRMVDTFCNVIQTVFYQSKAQQQRNGMFKLGY